MNAPPLRQPSPPAGMLEQFAMATVGLLGADSAMPLRGHLGAVAELGRADLALLYHGGVGAPELDLVASSGLPPEARPAFGHTPCDYSLGDEALAPGLLDLGIRARWSVPLWADGDCIGRLVFGSLRWDAFHPDSLAVFAATGAQIAVVLSRRITEQGDAKVDSSPDATSATGSEPLLFRRRRDRFIALLAHELRNPVAPIQSGLDLLATERIDAAARRDTVRMMQRQVAQLAHLIDDFIETARLNTGRLRAQRRPMRLLDALDTALESIAPVLRAKGQRIERAGGEVDTVVDADPVRLTQAFANVLAAAVAATPERGTLTVRHDIGAAGAVVVVEDQGSSLVDGEAERLFEPFPVAVVAERGAGPGSGLGLVRGLLALNEGTVVARNRDDGAGRMFVVTLPVAGDDLPAETTASAAQPAPSGHRILVVDDNRDAAESLGLLLRLDGHHVHLAHDGPGAVAAAKGFGPEIIVMDLGLPGFSGHEAIARIRASAGATRPGIIALTGWGTRADRDASAHAGADLHLVKPVVQAALNEAIRALVPPGEPVAATPHRAAEASLRPVGHEAPGR